MNKKLIRTVIAGVLVLAIAFAGFGGLKAVFAQTSTPETPTTTETPATPSTKGKEILPGRGYMMGTDDDALAAALGKTAAELQTARKAAYDLAIDQALADGAITQAQATLLKASKSTNWNMLSRFVGSEELAKLDEKALLAKALGITVEQLNAAYTKVRTDELAALVAAGQLTQAQADELAAREALEQSTTFQAEVKAGIEAAINNAVKAGTITQPQADALIAQLKASNGWGMGFGGMMDGMMYGKGMRGQGMFGQGGTGMFDRLNELFGKGGRGMNDQGMNRQGGSGQGGQDTTIPTPTLDGTSG